MVVLHYDQCAAAERHVPSQIYAFYSSDRFSFIDTFSSALNISIIILVLDFFLFFF